MATHRADALLVGGRVEPKTAVRAEGLEQAVALLPRAEQLRRDADPFAQRADAQIWGVHRTGVYTNFVQRFDMTGDEAAMVPHNLYKFSTRRCNVKKLDIAAAALLIVGGLNWGLVAIAEFDLVAALVGLEFGETNAVSRVIYGLVGASAVYQIAQQHAIRRRWSRDPRVSTA